MSATKDPEAARGRILSLRESLYRYFVGKNGIIDLMTIAAVAQEPMLIVGKPGTGKSEIILKFTEAMGLGGEDYFEYMLTEFSEPSEILGALDLSALKDGRFSRRVSGKLPMAKVAFLDEIFNSSSAILNVLLTILNERKYYDDGKPERAALRMLFAATNEIPDNHRMAALRDRFCIKVESREVWRGGVDGFSRLIDSGLKNEAWRQARLRPWQTGLATLEDFETAHTFLTEQMGRVDTDPLDDVAKSDRDRFMPREVQLVFLNLLETLAREHRVFISDRKVVKLYKLLRARAWLERNSEIKKEDLGLLACLGDTMEQLALLRQKVPQYLGLESANSHP